MTFFTQTNDNQYQYTKQEYQNSNEEIIDVEIIEDRKWSLLLQQEKVN